MSPCYWRYHHVLVLQACTCSCCSPSHAVSPVVLTNQTIFTVSVWKILNLYFLPATAATQETLAHTPAKADWDVVQDTAHRLLEATEGRESPHRLAASTATLHYDSALFADNFTTIDRVGLMHTTGSRHSTLYSNRNTDQPLPASLQRQRQPRVRSDEDTRGFPCHHRQQLVLLLPKEVQSGDRQHTTTQ